MSFSKSKRFNDKTEITPGPGDYRNDWGAIGSDSVKYSIHVTPRFQECCRKNMRGHRLCVECTCVDIATRHPSNEFTLNTPPNYSVQNITFRRRSAKSADEFRKALCDLIIFRQNCNSAVFSSFSKNESNKTVDITYDHVYLEENSEEIDQLSCSSQSDEDSGFSSPPQSPTCAISRTKRLPSSENFPEINKGWSFDLKKVELEDRMKVAEKNSTDFFVAKNDPMSKFGMLYRLVHTSVGEFTSEDQPGPKLKKQTKKVRFNMGNFECDQQIHEKSATIKNDKDKRISNTLSTKENPCGPISNHLNEILEGFLRSRGERLEENCSKQTFILKSLEILEEMLVNQKKETARILSLISLLEKEAMNL